ncbi:non-ribosomal peptide synthetase [Acetonema longum]|uniref:Tyrocidine synthetase III n=1 Tax=Acetonema longum DSM 6540 TaxID=1009370 RepID=F7NDT0_9FIRM|nr:non-ribosomal peptide synthetase [Acetonema longum]EGO65801.1 tyrocidine synthetase III [Acetonema longum DSM 6540]
MSMSNGKKQNEKKIKDIYLLSPMQEGMLYHSLLHDEASAYFEQHVLSIKGVLDIPLLEESLNRLIARYDVLRTVFAYEKVEKPVQVVLRERKTSIQVEDIGHLPAEAQQEFIQAFTRNDKKKGFDLRKDLLMRISVIKQDSERYKLVWSFHHIVTDGWCLGIILHDFLSIYTALRENREPDLKRVYPYSDYIKWLAEQDPSEAAAYWGKYVGDYEEQATLPKRNGLSAGGQYELAELSFRVDAATTQGIENIARQNNVTLNTVMQAIWGILLQRYNNTDDVVFGAVVSGRPHEIPGIESMVGLFINTLPVRIKGGGRKRFTELLREVQQAVVESERHSYYPLADIQAKTDLKGALLDHILVFENYPMEEVLNTQQEEKFGFRIEATEAFEQTSYDFNILVGPGKELTIKFSYNALVYDAGFISRLAQHINSAIRAVLRQADIPVGDIDILTEAEKRQILYDFNDTQMACPQDKTIKDLFEAQVEKSPDDAAVLFAEQALSFRELNRKANQLARALREKGVAANRTVGIMAERSLEMIIGIMGVLKAGGAYLPLDPQYPWDRISYMLEDSGTEIVLTQLRWLHEIAFNGHTLDLEDPGLYQGDGANLATEHTSRDLAYVIYTSGSTGRPKGVMIEQQSVINLLLWMQQKYPLTKDDVILQKTPFTFDVSVWELFAWAFTGAKVYMLKPGGEKDVPEMIRTIERHRITAVDFVPSLLSAFLDYMEGKDNLAALASLRRVFAAGEALQLYQVERFNRLRNKDFQAELINLYGPTETTVYASYFDCPPDQALAVVPIGKPLGNLQLYVLDKNNQLQPAGVAGELCIAGGGLARGYLNRPELTAEKFAPHPFRSGERMYRTGDLARWLPDGNVEYLGRIDHQVKIRGFRIELGEIETELLKHPAVKEAVVVAREEAATGKYLCAYFAAGQPLAVIQLRELLAKELPDYMIPAYFVQLDRMPLTASGKIDRKALPEPEGRSNTGAAYIAPRNEAEEKLARIWRQVLGIGQVGIHDNFFDLGGHSLKMITLVAKIHKEFGVEVPLQAVFSAPTISELAKLAGGAAQHDFTAIEPAPEQEYYPLSAAQKRLYVLSRFDNNETAYNMPSALQAEGSLDKKRLEEACRKLMARHETLRTSFALAAGEPVQTVHKEIDFTIDYCQAAPEMVPAMIQAFIRPFDLGQAPLFRVSVIETGETSHVLLFDMHHIISDGVSAGILVKELAALYEGKNLPALRIQYKDFSVWQNHVQQEKGMEQQEKYWLDTFAGELPALDLPTDYPRPPVRSFEGDRLQFTVGEELTEALNRLAGQSGATLYMVLLAAYNVLLLKYTGQEDIVVGSPIAGRPHADLENIVGMFVNTLAMRNYPAADKSFREFLAEVKANALQAYQHQEYQFEELVDKLNIPRDMSRNPLFDTMFALQNMDAAELAMGGLQFSPYELTNKIAKFDLIFQILERNNRLEFTLEYYTKILKRETVQRLAGHFVNVLAGIAANPLGRLAEFEMMTAEEKRQILDGFNNTKTLYPQTRTASRFFEIQAVRQPDNIAVAFEERRLTYRELNSKANQLARVLRKKGVKANHIVGVLAEQSPEMIIGIMGIAKAGGAYLPIDPVYPGDRISYMLEDSDAAILLAQRHLASKVSFSGETLELEDPALFQGDDLNLPRENTAADLAYVIYTSGSTGKPKGVEIQHASLNNFIHWHCHAYGITPADRTTKLAGPAFDASVWEIWPYLSAGAGIYIPNQEARSSTVGLIQWLKENAITVSFLPTPWAEALLAEPWPADIPLRVMLTGGDKLHCRPAPGLPFVLMNHYGPTETTVVVTGTAVCPDAPRDVLPTIGKPLDNTTIYILDRNNQLQPVGVAGEICVAGDCLAKGYLNRPELTAEKFVANPFQPGARMYRTGDLARWLPDGNIEFLGRIDQQVKIRGFRIELGEIEAELLKYPSVKEAAVIIKEDTSAGKYLCAYYAAEQELAVDGLRQHLARTLPDYMIPAYFMQLDKIPLTPNGKVDRGSLPQPEGRAGAGAAYAAPVSEAEVKLAGLWRQVLKVEQVGLEDNFFDLGGHSLKAITLVSRIQKEFGVEVPLQEIFRTQTVKELLKFMESAGQSGYADIKPVEEQAAYPVSSAQKRMFILNQFENDTAYNMPAVFQAEGRLDRQRLTEALQKLIARHETLRTSFAVVEGEPVQRVHKEIDFAVGYRQASEAEIPGIIKAFIRPFDLGAAPLFRVSLVEISKDNHVVLFDMHHIISDGVSVGILVKELAQLYAGEALPTLRIQYKDFSAWQRQAQQTEGFKRQEQYWLSTFAGELPVLNLPADYPRPPVRSFEGDSLRFELGEELTGALKSLAGQHGATPYMVLLAVYNVLLSKYTGQEDIIVGSPITGRPHADMENIVGMFVNTLAMRNYPAGNKSFLEYLAEVRASALQAFEHQDYPFEELVDKLDITRDLSRNSLFDTMFSLQNLDMAALALEDLKLCPYEFENKAAKFDLSLQATETERGLVFRLEYYTRLFHKDTAARLARHFVNIVKSIVAAPQAKLADIELLSADEKQQILIDFNSTEAPYPQDKTIQELFEAQAARHPDRIAVILEEQQLSYQTLNQKANQLARVLKDKGVKANSIVGIMTDRSLEMVVGIMAILKAGGAYLPVNPDYPQERVAYMLENSGAGILLTQNRFLDTPAFKGETLDLDHQGLYQGEAANLDRVNSAQDLAYVIYTSGSTGNPKGVMIKHHSAVNLFNWLQKQYPLAESDIILQRTSFAFDASVWELLWWATAGAKVCLLKPEGEKDPGEIIRTIHEQKVTTIQFVPSLLHVFLDYAAERAMQAKLSGLRRVFVGGEALTRAQVDQVYQVLGNEVRLINQYGPTEATVDASYFECSPEKAGEMIPIGRPLDNTRMYIVDRHNKLQPVGVAGELCIAGDGLAAGYLNRPELTAEKFVDNPFLPGERMYRTGDLARWLSDGNIEFLGRIDHQVKIRGFRIELGEIEAELLQHPAVKETVVTAQEDGSGHKYLCAYFTAEQELTPADLRQQAAKTLPDYMIPAYFLQLPNMPLTPNGKVDRKALPKPEGRISTGAGYIAPANETESKLAEIWQAVLGIEQIGTEDSFFDLGGHSLKAITLVARIHKELGAEVPLREVFKSPTIKELAKTIGTTGQKGFADIEPVMEQAYYPVSSAQKRMFVLNRFDQSDTAYNMPAVLKVEGGLDRNRLAAAVQKLIQRHETLRTSFEVAAGEPVQRVHKEIDFAVDYRRASAKAIPEIIRAFVRPFDLGQAPLLRVGLVETAENSHVLLFDMHHIISDGVSMGILVKELAGFYEGQELPGLRVQYKDFSAWQHKLRQGGAFKQREQYWLDTLGGELPVLDLPADYPRPPVRSFTGDHLQFEIGEQLTAAVNKLAGQTGTTPYMVLLAAYNILLSKYTGQEDIIVGSPIAGRPHADLEQVVGMFVNTLAMRNYPAQDKSFLEFLGELRENVLQAFEHQDYQFEELVETLDIPRNVSRNPLFDTMFALQNMDMAALAVNDLHFSPYPFENKIAKFDLTLLAVERDNKLQFTLEYYTRLFSRETMRRLGEHFANILGSVLRQPQIRLGDIDMMSGEEKRQILVDFNNTATAYPKDKTLQELFEEQAAAHPKQTAVVFNGQQLSYQELNHKANQLAGALRAKGVTPNRIVGIMVERSPEMIIGILGILKAGGAYLPIDPEYPEERIGYMLQDSSAALLITQPRLAAANLFKGEILDIDDPALYRGSCANLPRVNTAQDLAYVIYTSGSTGKPKGNLTMHYNVVRVVKNTNYIEITGRDVLLQLSNYAFDGSVFDIYGALLNGAKLVLVDRIGVLDIARLPRIIEQERVTVFFITTALFNTLVDIDIDCFRNIRKVLFGGEMVSVSHVRKAFNYLGGGKIIHVYGPTETTVFATAYAVNQLAESEISIPIGAPIANTSIYILGKAGQLQPVGIPGELCIAGDGLAWGYLYRPELTAEKFVPNPFLPGEKMYRTGDLARWLPDGNIEFLGRIDHQVKIRGFRIELGEIEAELLKHPAIKEATVIAKGDTTAEKYLCAYFTAGQELGAAELRGHLSHALPDYMIPAFLVQLEKMPLTPNGKIDRRALPEPDGGSGRAEYAAPRNEAEEKMAVLWQDILGMEKVGIEDSFFELGGHSIKAITLVARIHKEFGIEIPYGQFFKTPTIRELAAYTALPDAAGQMRRSYIEFNVHQDNTDKLFFFPPAVPLGLIYGHLAGKLEDYALYCFNLIDGDGKAKEYADTIIRIQPQGPYKLAGFSAGGVLTLEVARTLEKLGREVEIILIDSRYIKVQEDGVLEMLLERADAFTANMDMPPEARSDMKSFIQGKTMQYLTYLNSLVLLHGDKITADIHHICSTDTYNHQQDIAEEWARQTSGKFTQHNGFGPHSAMLEPGFAGDNAQIIKRILHGSEKRC